MMFLTLIRDLIIYSYCKYFSRGRYIAYNCQLWNSPNSPDRNRVCSDCTVTKCYNCGKRIGERCDRLWQW